MFFWGSQNKQSSRGGGAKDIPAPEDWEGTHFPVPSQKKEDKSAECPRLNLVQFPGRVHAHAIPIM